jgi:hypothetical protein
MGIKNAKFDADFNPKKIKNKTWEKAIDEKVIENLSFDIKFFYKNIFVLHIMTLFVVANFKTKIGRNG